MTETAESELGTWLDEQRQLAEEVGERLRKHAAVITAQLPPDGDPAVQELCVYATVPAPPTLVPAAPPTLVQVRLPTPTPAITAAALYAVPLPHISPWIYALLMIAILVTGGFEVLHLQIGLPIWFALSGHLAADIVIIVWIFTVRSYLGTAGLLLGRSRHVVHIPHVLRAFSLQLQQAAFFKQRVVYPPKALISIVVAITLTWLLWCLLFVVWNARLVLTAVDQCMQLFVMTHLALTMLWSVVILLYARCLRLLQ